MLSEVYHAAKDDLASLIKMATPDGKHPPPPTSDAHIIDSLSDMRVDFNFTSPHNPDLYNLRTFLVDAIFGNPSLKSKWISAIQQKDGADRGVVWETGKRNAFLDRGRELLKKILVLIHISSGSPGRGTELLSVKLVNTPADERNVYWMEGSITLFIKYWKGVAKSGKEHVRQISQLVDNVLTA